MKIIFRKLFETEISMKIVQKEFFKINRSQTFYSGNVLSFHLEKNRAIFPSPKKALNFFHRGIFFIFEIFAAIWKSEKLPETPHAVLSF